MAYQSWFGSIMKFFNVQQSSQQDDDESSEEEEKDAEERHYDEEEEDEKEREAEEKTNDEERDEEETINKSSDTITDQPIESTPLKKPTESTPSNTRIINSPNTQTPKYYVVLTPKDSKTFATPEDSIYTSFEEAAKSLKSVKGSRVKVACSPIEALTLSMSGLDFSSESTTTVNDIESSTIGGFSSPTPPQLAKLRRTIESGNLQEVEEIISDNPRYLISSGDGPVILMEGPRYNAIHVAAKFNKHEIMKYILNTIDDASFVRKMYPLDEDFINEERRRHLLDLYLNTPDKVNLDTPLHFACKFGAYECVKILIGYLECERRRPNKLNQSAREVICCREGNNERKKLIEKLFRGRALSYG